MEAYHQVNQVAMVKFVFSVVSEPSTKAYKANLQNKGQNWARANFVTQITSAAPFLFANSLHADSNSDGLFCSVIWPAFCVGGGRGERRLGSAKIPCNFLFVSRSRLHSGICAVADAMKPVESGQTMRNLL
jgi:hypothetical protein